MSIILRCYRTVCAKRTALDGIIEGVEFRPGPTLVSSPKLVTRILAALLWSVCLPCATGQSLSLEDKYEGRRIASISYEPESQPYTRLQLERLNPVKAGDRFASEAVSAAIETLFDSGRFEDIAVDAALTPAGEVNLTFRTVPAWFIGGVSVTGAADPPSDGQLITAAKLELGQSFTEDYLIDATRNILASLRNNGFYRATVEPRFSYDPLTQQVQIDFRIAHGQRARFANPVFTGDHRRTAASLFRATNWQRAWGLLSAKHLTEQRLVNGLERIRFRFQKSDFLMARVKLEGLRYLPASNQVEPAVAVHGGPRVRVRATGAKLSAGKLRQLVPIYQERTVDRDLLVEGNRNIERYFQTRGYFDAAVDFDNPTNPGDAEQTIEYNIDRGLRYKLVHLEITGNRYFDSQTIAERLSVRTATRLRYRSGRFSDELLRKDLDAIQALYRSNGFRDARVTSRVDKNYRGNLGEVAVFVDIQEGPQAFIASLDIAGVNPKDLELVQSQLQTVEGQPYADVHIAADRDFLLNFYFNNGFPDAAFEYTVKPAGAPHQFHVRYLITEGRRNFVRRVLVSGYRTTRPRLIYDRIPIATGDPLSQSAIIEAQRRLYELGIFAKVDIALQNPNGRERDKYVLYRLEEASRYSYTIGFGAQLARIGGGNTTLAAPAGAPGFSPRVSFGLSRANFLGLGHTLGLRSQISNFQKRIAVSYFAPQFTGNESLNLNLTSLFDQSRDVRTFAAERFENSIQIGQRLSRSTSLQYRYAFRQVRIDRSTLNIDPALIPVFSVPVRIGIFSSSFIRDRRDDPIESTKGVFTTIDTGLAYRAFGSRSDFGRLLIRNSAYRRLSRELVLAQSLTVGSIYSFNTATPDASVPLPERFFSGGGASNRAFPDNQAGPRDLTTGFPIGGRALLNQSLELRFPLLGDTLGGVLFHDAGNVYSSLGKVSFRLKQRDITDFDYMVHGMGFGIRFKTPVGPVRLDLAYGLNSPRFFGYEGTRDQLIQGGGRAVSQRIDRLQFHFSLGQTF